MSDIPPPAPAPFGGLPAAHDILCNLTLQIQETLAQPVTDRYVVVPSDRILAWRRAVEQASDLIFRSIAGVFLIEPARSIFRTILAQLALALQILRSFRFPERDPVVLLRVPLPTLQRLLQAIQLADGLLASFLSFRARA